MFDHDLSLVCWNNQFRNLLSLPPEMGKVGVPLGEVLSRLDRHFEYEGSGCRTAENVYVWMCASSTILPL